MAAITSGLISGNDDGVLAYFYNKTLDILCNRITDRLLERMEDVRITKAKNNTPNGQSITPDTRDPTGTNDGPKDPIEDTGEVVGSVEDLSKSQLQMKKDLNPPDLNPPDLNPPDLNPPDLNPPLRNTRYQSTTVQYDYISDTWVPVEEEDTGNPNSGAECDTKAFEFQRRLDDEGNFDCSTVKIHSITLRQLLKDAMGDVYPEYFVTQMNTQELEFSAITSFVHAWEALKAKCNADEEDSVIMAQAKQDLRKLLDLIRGSSELKDYFKVRDKHLDLRITSFENVWALFPPRSLIITRACMSDFVQVLEVYSCLPDMHTSRGVKSQIIEAWCYDFDGTKYIERVVQLDIEAFTGSQPINSLRCYPISYFTDVRVIEHLEKVFEIPQIVTGGQGIDEALPKSVAAISLATHGGAGPSSMPKDGQIQARLMNALICRGQRFDEYTSCANTKPRGPVLVHCEGEVLSTHRADGEVKGLYDDEDDGISTIWGNTVKNKSLSGVKPTKIKADVIVDFSSYLEYWTSTPQFGSLVIHPRDINGCDCPRCSQAKQYRDNAEQNVELLGQRLSQTEIQQRRHILRAFRLLGWWQTERCWVQFPIESLTTPLIENRRHGWDKFLQIPHDYKEAIFELIDSHCLDQPDQPHEHLDLQKPLDFDDYTKEKGKSVVLLFYGPPGVGKTLTAELAAEATGKCLIPVGVSDIGLRPEKVERNLRRIFNLAQRWKAILLIDEADVFLEAREGGASNDRNQLVVVMLRVLEYYSGVVVLTTNRIPSIDVAVFSRVHLAIKFDDLNKSQMWNIWNSFLEKVNFKPNERDLQRIVQVESKSKIGLNGRQIRNIVTTAMASANARAYKQGIPPRIDWNDILDAYNYVKIMQETLGEEILRAKMQRSAGRDYRAL